MSTGFFDSSPFLTAEWKQRLFCAAGGYAGEHSNIYGGNIMVQFVTNPE